MKYLLIALIVVYLIWPHDVIPDFAGFVGRVDDVLLAGYLLYRWWRVFRGFGNNSPENEDSEKPKVDTPRDAYVVLGVDRSASKEEIVAAYRQKASEYHPDKVNHLGSELKELAHKKMLEIQRAYEELIAKV